MYLQRISRSDQRSAFRRFENRSLRKLIVQQNSFRYKTNDNNSLVDNFSYFDGKSEEKLELLDNSGGGMLRSKGEIERRRPRREYFPSWPTISKK